MKGERRLDVQSLGLKKARGWCPWPKQPQANKACSI